NPQTPMDYARQTAATVVRAVVRARASSLSIRPFVCWADEGSTDSIGLSRPLTASAQPPSARRADIHGTPPSPSEIQQFRYSPYYGEDRVVAVNETFVTSRQTSATSSNQTTNPPDSLHIGAAVSPMCQPRNYEIEASYEVGAAAPEEFPQRIYRPYDPTADTPTSHYQGQAPCNAAAPCLEIDPSNRRLDAELHFAWLDAQEDKIHVPDRALCDPFPRQRQPRYIIPDEAERRQGRVFDTLTDYTQPSSSHPTKQQRGDRGLVRTRRALPRSPPRSTTPVEIESIPAKIIDTKTGEVLPRSTHEYGDDKTKPRMLISTFNPSFG
ncbi:MAG: hypothetical protein Q9224_007465, partial [Gallowayella concinna]